MCKLFDHQVCRAKRHVASVTRTQFTARPRGCDIREPNNRAGSNQKLEAAPMIGLFA